MASLLSMRVQSAPSSNARSMPMFIAPGKPIFFGKSIMIVPGGTPLPSSSNSWGAEPLSMQMIRSGGGVIRARLRSAANVSVGGPQLITRLAVFTRYDRKVSPRRLDSLISLSPKILIVTCRRYVPVWAPTESIDGMGPVGEPMCGEM